MELAQNCRLFGQWSNNWIYLQRDRRQTKKRNRQISSSYQSRKSVKQKNQQEEPVTQK